LIANGQKLTPLPHRARQVAGPRFEQVGLLRVGPAGQRAVPSSGSAPYSRTITSPASISTGLTVLRLPFATATTRTAGEKPE